MTRPPTVPAPGRRPSAAPLAAVLAAVALAGSARPAPASDHADVPLLGGIGRHDARITDLYAFTRGDRLVLAMGLNPAVPPSAADYRFSSDLKVRFHIDNRSAVSFADEGANQVFGGEILRPGKIDDSVVLEVAFDASGRPRLVAKGLPRHVLRDVLLFAGLRDDPFIRGPREGRNVAAVVVSMPLAGVLRDRSELLIWGTTDIPDARGRIADHAGRALRSMFPEDTLANALAPRDHFRRLGIVPDVVIFDTSRPALFPNGRDLPDDVMDDVNDPRVMGNDTPFPTENDLPFLDEFPYLAPPHPPAP